MKRIKNYFIFAIFIILLISIGSVFAVTDDVSISNSNGLSVVSDNSQEDSQIMLI